jgi:GT2 family glycosyltransferase
MARTALIIPTFNQEDFTIRCFESIMRHTNDYLLVWIDNGSSHESKMKVMNSFLKHEERLSIWSSENLGFVKGINNALDILLKVRRVDCEFIAILNNDIEVTKTWLEKMISVLERDPKVSAVGPVSSAESSLQGWNRLFRSVNISHFPNLQKINTDKRARILDEVFGDKFVEAPMGRSCPMIAFFCTLFRREVFTEIGNLDPIYGLGYGDDDDLCRRIYDHGGKVSVALGAYVFHNHRTTFNAILSKEEINQIKRKNLARYDKKFGLG